MANRIPTLTVIAGRGESRLEETHRTRARWKDDLETAGKIIFYALVWIAACWFFAAMILSLGVPR